MRLQLAHRRVRGSWADLFFPPSNGRVYKLFRKPKAERWERCARAVFEAEAQAYEIVHANFQLRRHTPKFFGRAKVDAVLDRGGRNQGYRYLLDCCYSIARLEGPDCGVFGVPDSILPHMLLLLERFEEAGIDYVGDASVFGWGDPDTMQLVDFAVHDAAANY